MRATLLGRAGVEMTADPAFLARVRRLAVVSAVALGVIWVLAVTTLEAHPLFDRALLLGWAAMPTVLGFSVHRARIRFLVALPAGLVGAALVAICITALPGDGLARAGWLSITGGVLIGAGLGAWFWFRWLPVPESLDDPFSPGRWVLIAVHVTPVVAGLLLVLLAQLV